MAQRRQSIYPAGTRLDDQDRMAKSTGRLRLDESNIPSVSNTSPLRHLASFPKSPKKLVLFFGHFQSFYFSEIFYATFFGLILTNYLTEIANYLTIATTN